MLTNQIRTLKPSKEELVSTNGYRSELLNLKGTIPIHYSGNRYNIPVVIWIPLNYPREPPSCFVTPTADMTVRAGHHHVDMEGRVYLPYLAEWARSAERSNLVELMAIMQSVFGKAPPVWRKKTTTPAPAPAAATGGFRPSYRDPASAAAANAATKSKLVAELSGKIRTAMTSELTKIRDEIDRNFALQSRLEKSKADVTAGLESFSRGESSASEMVVDLDNAQRRLETWLAEREGESKDVDVEDILEPGDPLSAQMIEANAEYHAYEDAMYHMEKALQNGSVDIESFLMASRRFSQKQFIALALSQKIQREQHRLSAGASI